MVAVLVLAQVSLSGFLCEGAYMLAVVGVNRYLCRDLGGASAKRGTYMLAVV